MIITHRAKPNMGVKGKYNVQRNKKRTARKTYKGRIDRENYYFARATR